GDTETGGDGEGAEIVSHAASDGGDVVCKAAEILLPLALPLLAKEVETRLLLGSRVIGVNEDVVILRVCGEEAVHSAGGEEPALEELIQQGIGLFEQIARLVADVRVIENLRILALHLPGHEERRPVDVRPYLVQRKRPDDVHAKKARSGDRRL